MIDHGELARELFMKGYNCAQAVACAFCDVTGYDIDAMARMASSFGGGLGRLREVCGTVSGAALVLGIVEGYSEPGDMEAKKAHYPHKAQACLNCSGLCLCQDRKHMPFRKARLLPLWWQETVPIGSLPEYRNTSGAASMPRCHVCFCP